MEDKPSLKNKANLTGVISLSMSLVVYLLILNWFFKMIPYQKLEGMPLLVAPLIGLIGLYFGYISHKKYPNNLAKWSLISNAILIILPFLYWTLGTWFFGV